MNTALMLLAMTLGSDTPGGKDSPRPPEAGGIDYSGKLNFYFHLDAKSGLIFYINLWERIADGNGKLGDFELLLDVRTRLGLGRGVYFKGSGTFEDPIWFAPTNRGIGTLTCVRISPRIEKSRLWDELFSELDEN